MASLHLNEDDIYRTSSQYRLWSFTPESLAAARDATNKAAAKRVQAVLGNPIDPLTVAEELALVRRSCLRAIALSNHMGVPSSVRISAVQFLKRFYVTHSCMEYPPAKLIASALFLGTKSNGINFPLDEFAKKAGKKEQEIIAPEFKLAQGNRFAFEIRSPSRGLEGGYIALLEIATGRAPGPEAAALKQDILKLYGQAWENKLATVIQQTRELLKKSALICDAYFLYTPPQIWIAALMVSDERLAQLYLRATLYGLSQDQQKQLTALLKSCAAMLAQEHELVQEMDEMEEKRKVDPAADAEIKRLNQKLKHCTNPDTSDLVELNAAQKRDPDPSISGNATKKLKTEKGQIEDPFGPALVKQESK